jgi:hypothetical protein
MEKLQPYWCCPGCQTPINSKQNVKKHRDKCVFLKRTMRPRYASEISETSSQKHGFGALIATSEKDRQNELALNDSVCDQSFEFEQSCEPFTMPDHDLPTQQMQMQHLGQPKQQI